MLVDYFVGVSFDKEILYNTTSNYSCLHVSHSLMYKDGKLYKHEFIHLFFRCLFLTIYIHTPLNVLETNQVGYSIGRLIIMIINNYECT